LKYLARIMKNDIDLLIIERRKVNKFYNKIVNYLTGIISKSYLIAIDSNEMKLNYSRIRLNKNS
jgi:hypothetical protein